VAISRLSTSSPAANTNVLLYTRVGSRVALASVIATNKGATSATLRVWVVPNGQDSTPAHHAYITYDSVIDANDSLETFRFPLTSLDKLYIRTSSSDLSVILSGIDNTNVAETEFTAVQDKANSKASTFLLMGA
jgi:hypothetical protein